MPRSVFNKANRFVIAPAVAGLIVAFAPLQAQQPAPSTTTPTETIPPGPLMKSAPSSSRWIVEFQYADENPKSKKPPQLNPETRLMRVKKITTTRTLPVSYEEKIDEAGNKTERWFSDNQQYIRKSGTPDFYTAGNKDIFNTNYEYHSPTGFQGFEWISKKNFSGIQKVLDRDCLIFRDRQMGEALSDPNEVAFMKEMALVKEMQKEPGATKQEGEPPATSAESPVGNVGITACIDLETRLPTALQIGGETRIFTFLDPPTTPVTLPPELAKQLEQRQKLWNAFARPAPRPY